MAVYVAVASLWSSCTVITPTVHLSSEVSQDIVPSSLASWIGEALSAYTTIPYISTHKVTALVMFYIREGNVDSFVMRARLLTH